MSASNSRRKPLVDDIRLYTAKLDGRAISVYHDNELVGQGVIESITNETVKINGEHYFRESCEFWL